MRIIRPITITDEMIVSCSVPEDDYAAWSEATAYVAGDRCILAHKIYEASASSTDKSPDTNADLWFEISATNRWKVFDEKVLDQTMQNASTMVNCAIFNGSGYFISLDLNHSSFSNSSFFIEFNFIVTSTSIVNVFLGSYNGSDSGIDIFLDTSGKINLRRRVASLFSDVKSDFTCLPGTEYRVGIQFNKTTGMALFYNSGLLHGDPQTVLYHDEAITSDSNFYIGRLGVSSPYLSGKLWDVNINGIFFPLSEGSGTSVYGYDGGGVVAATGDITATDINYFWGERVLGGVRYMIRPTAIFDSVALLNISASSVEITVTDQIDGIVYSLAESLTLTDQVFDLYTFFFEETENKKNFVKLDLPPYLDATITITLTGSGEVGAGEIVIGKQANLGFTEWNPSVGTKSYSSKGTDTFGNFVVVKRPYSATMSCSVFLPPSRFDFVKRRLDQFRDEPVVWVGSVDSITGENMYESMMIYGFLDSFDMVIPGPQESGYNIEIIGLT